MADTALIDVINNEYELYDSMIEMFDEWVAKSETVDATERLRRASIFAQAAAKWARKEYGYYSPADVAEGAKDILDQFPEHEENALEAARKRATAPVVASPPMDEGAVAHAKKYEALARKIGIEDLVALMPVSREKIRYSLDRGDRYLNWIPLRLWDRAGAGINYPNLSMAERTSLLKHVAQWHYA